MPTIFRKDGYRFFFYSNEHEPIHVHIEGGSGIAKYNLFPVELVSSSGFKAKDLKKIAQIVEENKFDFLQKWLEFFGI